MSIPYAGRYALGEVPQTPLQYQFLDGDGYPLDITLATSATFLVADPDGTTVSHNAEIVSAWNGIVAVAWSDEMTDLAGGWEARFWLEPGPVASVLIRWVVVAGPGPTVPAP